MIEVALTPELLTVDNVLPCRDELLSAVVLMIENAANHVELSPCTDSRIINARILGGLVSLIRDTLDDSTKILVALLVITMRWLEKPLRKCSECVKKQLVCG